MTTLARQRDLAPRERLTALRAADDWEATQDGRDPRGPLPLPGAPC